jgi:alkyl hydroperoxide reductase subunit AhpC
MVVARVGEAAPDFALTCVSAIDTDPHPARLSDYAGKWLVLIFYPRDFSFVCPTELTAFSAHLPEFDARGCQLLGVSVDSIKLHREWLSTPASQGGLGPLQFPLASDPDGHAARAYGVWVQQKAVATRGLFVIDSAGVLQYAVVHNLSVGRRPDVVLRVVTALQAGGLCPANWSAADGTIDLEKALQPGRILGHYRIRRRLGGGTFGTVFAAWDLRLERLVALKVLKRNVIESRAAILSEARTAARLSHPHVCTIYAVEEEDGLPVIAMEYLQGKTLSQAIAEGLSPTEAQRLATQIVSGLAAAHGEDVVHGDLKPENIIVTDDDVTRNVSQDRWDGTISSAGMQPQPGSGTCAKILDFGLARSQSTRTGRQTDAHTQQPPSPAAQDALADTASSEATVDYVGLPSEETGRPTETIRGTPAYMSPEQAAGLPATPASDVFSFGLVLFEMLTGRRARPELPPVTLLLDIETHDLGTELVQSIDPRYRDLLTATLALAPENRPAMMNVARQLTEMDSV